MEPHAASRVWSRAFWCVAVIASVAFALSFGFNHGVSNQLAYLAPALVRFDPSLLPHDWYARDAADVHSVFSRLAAVMFAIHDGPEEFVALELALTVLGCLAIASLVRSFSSDPRDALPIFLGWLALAFVLRTTDTMGSFLFAGYLQPSSFGETGVLWAAAFFARRRYLLGGAALALGGLLHLNFLVLGIATFGLAQLAMCTRAPWRDLLRELAPRLLRQFALPALVFVWALPKLLEAAATYSAEATRIVVEVRAPHHFRPTFELLLPFVAWQVAAWLVVAAQLRPKADAAQRWAGRPMVALLFGIGGFILVASLLTTVVHVELVLQSFPWRLAPLATLLAQIIILGAATTAARRGAALHQFAALAGAALIAAGLAVPAPNRLWLGALALAFVVVLVARRLGAGAVPVIAAMALGAVLTATAIGPLRSFTPEIHALQPKKRALIQWALTKTEKDALFAVPPAFGDFRFFARRSVVVDWKSPGAYAKDILSWYDRMNRIAGTTSFRSMAQVTRGYARMDRARAERLRDDFGVDYLVLDKAAELPDLGEVVYQDARWIVFAVPPAGT